MERDLPTNEVLVQILEMLKDQAQYIRRLQGWMTAAFETIAQDSELLTELKRHPFYDQGPRPTLQKIDVMTQNIDVLIRRLKEPQV